MNRYGDSPLGMVESALEFIRIAESHGYQDICLSMKASNPKVMIEAYRLAVARMEQEGMAYLCIWALPRPAMARMHA